MKMKDHHMSNIVSRAQHNELRLKHAEGLLIEFQRLALNLNPNMPIEANSGKMMEFISLADKSYSFVHVDTID